MSTTSSPASSLNVYRVRNWQQLLGPQKSRAHSGPLGRLARITLSPCPGMSTLIRKRLFNLPQGVASYSVWLLLVQIAAQTSIPGCFLDEQTPLTPEDLSLLTDVPREEMRVALDNLARPEIRLLELITLEEALRADNAIEPPRNSELTPSEAERRLNSLTSIPPVSPPASALENMPKAVSPEKDHITPSAVQRALSPALKDGGSAETISQSSGSSANEAEEAEQQLARLLGVFNQVQQMKQEVSTLSAPLHGPMQARKHRRRGK